MVPKQPINPPADPHESSPSPARAATAEDYEARRWQLLAQATGQILWSGTPDGQAQPSHSWQAFTGQTEEEAAGWGWLQAVHPDDRAQLREEWQRNIAAKRPFRAELRLRRHDGVYRAVAAGVVPVLGPDGEVSEWVAGCADVTERRALERTALEQSKQLALIFATTPDGVVVYDLNGGIVRTNPAARAIYGLDLDPTYEHTPYAERVKRIRLSDPSGQPLPYEQGPVPRLLRGEQLTGANTLEIRVTLADGTTRHVSISGAPLYDDDGRIIGAVTFNRDVTDQQRLQRRTHEGLTALLAMAEALAQQDEIPSVTLQRVIELTRQVLDAEYTGLAVSDAATDEVTPLAVTGLAPETEAEWWWRLRAARLTDYVPPDVAATLRAGTAIQMNLRDQPPLPEQSYFGVRHVLAVSAPFGEGQVALLGVESRDETPFVDGDINVAQAALRLATLVLTRDQLRAEREQARIATLALTETARRMDEFLGVAAHELRTPLTVVLTNLQLLQRQASRLPEGQRPRGPLLERTEHAARRLARLVDDLVDVSRIRAGRLQMRPERVDVRAIAREAVDGQRLAHADRQIRLERPDEAVPVVADPDRVFQVVTNFLTNALKYSPADQPVEVRVTRQDGRARVAVRDHGPGISSDEHERVWELFHRVPGIEVQSGSGVGLGLGLHISRTIIERHGGQTGVESVPGQGATFWFTLPLATSEI